MTALRFLIITVLLALVPAQTARAHALEPGYLQITPMGGPLWQVFWRKPDTKGKPMPIDARLPDTCTPALPPEPTFDGRAWMASWAADCPAGLTGGTIRIDGLERTRTDVLVRFETADGQVLTQRLTREQTAFDVPADPGPVDVLKTYLPLGVEHILGGFDHLLFVFALLLLIPDRWRLLGAITAFTLAHSITMAAATLGWITLPAPPVEAVIALSIMFLASELLHRDPTKLRASQRYPWIVSFSFGLLHGFGFAGALQDIGLPQGEVPLALLSFNLGVEAGQLMFVAAVLALAAALRALAPAAMTALTAPRAPLATASAYAIGGVSAYWFIDRVAGFWA
jgi:hydrogenase/urease accessory protein HupE